jgi:small-conductance mechanosensitive channel
VLLLLLQVLVKSTGERCYFPNTRLITLPVVNLTRSVARSEKVVISLNVGQTTNAAREALLVSHTMSHTMSQ